MTSQLESASSVDPRIYFAAERNLLAWVRTALALMGLGFVIARFGLFLRELAAAGVQATQQPLRLSLWVGALLVISGIVVNLGAALQYARLIRRLNRGETLQFRIWSIGTGLALFLALIGAALVVVLTLRAVQAG
jgi:putative membrane protein